MNNTTLLNASCSGHVGNPTARNSICRQNGITTSWQPVAQKQTRRSGVSLTDAVIPVYVTTEEKNTQCPAWRLLCCRLLDEQCTPEDLTVVTDRERLHARGKTRRTCLRSFSGIMMLETVHIPGYRMLARLLYCFTGRFKSSTV